MVIDCEQCGNEIKNTDDVYSCDECQGYVHRKCQAAHERQIALDNSD